MKTTISKKGLRKSPRWIRYMHLMHQFNPSRKELENLKDILYEGPGISLGIEETEN